MTHRSDLRRYGLFDAKVPRFTSYPPANRFTPSVGGDVASQWLAATPENGELSLYIHIPFCRRLCWFCACRTQGTKTDAPLGRYIDSVIREMSMVRAQLPQSVRVTRLHLGGGTPTILPVPLMTKLLNAVAQAFDLSELAEFSVEIDPTEIDAARLSVLADAGLSRASIGVQDFDPRVQDAIGRTQSVAATAETVAMLRDAGIAPLNIDLLYGLPFQTKDSLSRTLDEVLELGPTRLALYGYAHVPWMSKRQMVIPSDALPVPEARFDLFELAQRRLVDAGYLQIGIDHFARPEDGLAVAMHEGRLGRSFQGYTDDRVPRLIGLGASSISRFPEGYVQNQPATALYQTTVGEGRLAAYRGIGLSAVDRAKGDVIEELMCYHEVSLDRLPAATPDVAQWLADLAAARPDAMSFDGKRLVLADWARPLVRIFAAELGETLTSKDQVYSAAI